MSKLSILLSDLPLDRFLSEILTVGCEWRNHFSNSSAGILLYLQHFSQRLASRINKLLLNEEFSFSTGNVLTLLDI